MRTLSAAMQAHVAQEVTTLCTCWKLTKQDGTVLGFTDNSADVVYGGVTYEASTGFTPSDIKSSEGLAVDNMDMVGLLDSVTLSTDALLAGEYDLADIEIFMVNYNDLTMGDIKLAAGTVGEVKSGRVVFEAEFRSLAQKLIQVIGETYSPTCRADLGDSRCQVVVDATEWSGGATVVAGDIIKPAFANWTDYFYQVTTGGTTDGTEPTWSTTLGGTTTETGGVEYTTITSFQSVGSITAVTSNELFTDSSRVEADNYFDRALITFLDGENAGISRTVKTFLSNQFQLELPFPYSIQVADKYRIVIGCDKVFATCRDTFDNVVNFRGEPHLPGVDQISKFGGQ